MNNNVIDNNASNPINNERGNNKTSTFNLIIGIATLLIALLGATFAYFSATARSAEGDVTVKSAYVSIEYDGGTEIRATNLIPATQQVALTKFKKEMQPYNPEVDGDIITDYDFASKNNLDRRCVDANGREVCYVYQFSVVSDGTPYNATDGTGGTDILASVQVNSNEFQNLSYVLYEVTFKQEDGVDLTDKYGFKIVDTYQVVSSFSEVDTNPDNVDFVDVSFAKFETPRDIFDDDGAYLETLYPVACLFGNSVDANTKEINDTSRCLPYKIKDNEKHWYQLVIWLEETGEVQPEQGKNFSGTVAIEVVGGFDSGSYGDNGQITGKE